MIGFYERLGFVGEGESLPERADRHAAPVHAVPFHRSGVMCDRGLGTVVRFWQRPVACRVPFVMRSRGYRRGDGAGARIPAAEAISSGGVSMPTITRDQVRVPADVPARVARDLHRQLHGGDARHRSPDAVRVRPEDRAHERRLLRRGHLCRRRRSRAPVPDRLQGVCGILAGQRGLVAQYAADYPGHQLPGQDELQDAPGEDERRTTRTARSSTTCRTCWTCATTA